MPHKSCLKNWRHRRTTAEVGIATRGVSLVCFHLCISAITLGLVHWTLRTLDVKPRGASLLTDFSSGVLIPREPGGLAGPHRLHQRGVDGRETLRRRRRARRRGGRGLPAGETSNWNGGDVDFFFFFFFFFFFTSLSHVCMRSIWNDNRLHAARSYTSTPDSPFSL